MTHGGPSFTLRLKTHKAKKKRLFHRRLNQGILKLTKLIIYDYELIRLASN